MISFGDNNKGFTMGYEKLKIGNDFIENIALIDNLMHNLLSISQFCDKGLRVDFKSMDYTVTYKKTGELALMGVRKGNLYVADLDSAKKDNIYYFYGKASTNESWLWHKKLSHINFKAINYLVKKELVI